MAACSPRTGGGEWVVGKTWDRRALPISAFGMRGCRSQVRRAAVSIPCNLAEGRGRGTRAEMARFAHIALGSVYELDTLLLIAAELDLAGASQVTALRDRLSSLSR